MDGAAMERASGHEGAGFINHVPRTREEREAKRDKDKLEKKRLQVGRSNPRTPLRSRSVDVTR